jgi:hypothetical protein
MWEEQAAGAFSRSSPKAFLRHRGSQRSELASLLLTIAHNLDLFLSLAELPFGRDLTIA